MNKLDYKHIILAQFTYEMSHVDIDTSCEKVVNLLHQVIITCFKQHYLLGQKVGVEGKVGKSSYVGNEFRDQSTWYTAVHDLCGNHNKTGRIQSSLTAVTKSGM